MIRARLARMVGPAVQFVAYLGPLALVPAGWTITKRRPARRSMGA